MLTLLPYRILRRIAIELYKMGAHPLILDRVLYLAHLVLFLARHKRIPMKPDRLFNDFLFQLKTSSEIGGPLRTYITDKEFGKLFIEKKLGPGTTPITLAILRTAEEIDRYHLVQYPSVIKPTNSFGRVVVARSQDDYDQAKATMKKWLSEDYFLTSLEKNYAKLERKVLIEDYIEETFVIEGSVHCLWGQPRIISLIDRQTKARQSFDVDRVPLGVSLAFPLKQFEPEHWDFWVTLLENSRILSSEFRYIRVDFYTDGKRLLFGELTNLPAGGNGKFFPSDGEERFSAVFFSSSGR